MLDIMYEIPKDPQYRICGCHPSLSGKERRTIDTDAWLIHTFVRIIHTLLNVGLFPDTPEGFI